MTCEVSQVAAPADAGLGVHVALEGFLQGFLSRSLIVLLSVYRLR